MGDVASEFTSSVPATFKIGDETVTEDFQVVKSGDDWKMNEVGSTIDFTSTRSNTLPMMLNGKSLEVDKATLFPGSYTLSTGTDNVAYGTTGEFTVKGSADYLNGSDLTPTLTPEGEQAFVNAVKASTRACLQKKLLKPPNCPNEAGNGPYKLDKSSIKWKKRGGSADPFANLKPRLDYESPNVAEVRPNLSLDGERQLQRPEWPLRGEHLQLQERHGRHAQGAAGGQVGRLTCVGRSGDVTRSARRRSPRCAPRRCRSNRLRRACPGEPGAARP